MNKILHFVTLGGTRWPYPLINAIREAQKSGMFSTLDETSFKYFGHIYYKVNIIDSVFERVEEQWNIILNDIENYTDDNIFTSEKEGYALKANDNIRYRIVADLEFILYEINSMLELMTKLIEPLLKEFGFDYKYKNKYKRVKEMLELNQLNTSWHERLHDFRNEIIHDGAARIAVEVKTQDNLSAVLLLKSIKFPNDEKEYMTYDEIKSIYRKAYGVLYAVRTNIIKMIRDKIDESDISKLTAVVNEFRKAIGSSKINYNLFEQSTDEISKTNSLLLGLYLEEKGFGEFNLITGTTENQRHYWLEKDGIVADVTADHFDWGYKTFIGWEDANYFSVNNKKKVIYGSLFDSDDFNNNEFQNTYKDIAARILHKEKELYW
jgi:hypothetical protein